MPKRAMTIVCGLCAGFTVFALTPVIAFMQNQLINPGFETLNGDGTAANWIQFGGSGINNTNYYTSLTVHSGVHSLAVGSPGMGTLTGAGAYQDVVAASGQNWQLTGYLFTWLNARVTGPDYYAVAQLVFLDSANDVLQVNESPHYGSGTPLPVNTWVFFEVDATDAPPGTAKVRTYVMYVGDNLDGGTFFFDDLALYTPASPTPLSVTVQPAVQISWPTSSQINGINYQVQSTTDLVFTPSQGMNPNVLVNPGFEANAVPNDSACTLVTPITGWSLGGVAAYDAVDSGGPANSNACYPVHGGIGALAELANNNPPVVYQSFPASPGQVWAITGYGYICKTTCGLTPDPSFRGLLKIVWNDAGGNPLPPVTDTNLFGSLETAPYYGIASSPQLTSGSSADTWTLLQCQGTAPAGTASVAFYNITVGNTGEMMFDDENAFHVTTPQAAGNNFGPVWLASGVTNQVVDPITGKQKFYRITAP